MTDLRCPHGILGGVLDVDAQVLDVKCRSSRCGHQSGVVVIHRYSTVTGQLVRTFKFRDGSLVPGKEKVR